ncbi:multiheme c-type cytochrome [Agarivorans albus]
MKQGLFGLVFVWLGVSLCLSAAEYVGTNNCIECHQTQYQQWQGSHHDMAMRHANEQSILGDFANASLEFAGKTNRFFRKGAEYWVNIEGPNGDFSDYQITYTFGFEPLQQYMVEFADGRVQLIPFAWDSRSKQQGGQRWFHLYPNQQKTDEFYWTNAGQNWNYMCADCHSTQLQKGYDSSSNTYNTTWFEINVGCEACHGPASDHIKWTQSDNKQAALANLGQYSGFSRTLQTAVSEWTYQAGESTLSAASHQQSQQLKVCAQCHSRRSQISGSNDHVAGSLLDRYQPSLITAELYHDDGQIYDEVYVWGSFQQSKMKHAGVSCSNCHNVHSGQLKLAEPALCAQCHVAAEYTPEKHSFHPADSEAAMCSSCHMPATTYMQVDPRRDHSWQVPRPDLSQAIGTPNVCTSCHQDKDNNWALQWQRQWFPKSNYLDNNHFSEAFFAADQGLPSAEQALAYVAQNPLESSIIRASALERLAQFPGRNSVIATARAVSSEQELIRIGAVSSARHYPIAERWRLLSPLLDDSTLAVRSETAASLVKGWASLTEQQQQQLRPALKEYQEVQLVNADRAFALNNLAGVYLATGEFNEAEASYLQAIKIEPYFANSYVNLADLYRHLGNETAAFNVLKQGRLAQPASAAIPYSTGLSLLRQKKAQLAVSYFAQATELEPSNAHYWYVYGLSLEAFDLAKAQQVLNKAYDTGRNPQHLFALCEMKVRHKDRKAQLCILQLQAVVPAEVAQRLKRQLNQ